MIFLLVPILSIENSKSADITANSKSTLSFKEDGAPYCTRFNDIYFDSESGYQQSDDIFICSNNIKQRFIEAKSTITIAETGFGTGLNFLLTLQAYQNAQSESSQDIAPLHFISVEKYPLNKKQLQQSLTVLPELSKYAEMLLEQYPSSHTLTEQVFEAPFLNNKVHLTIIFDDASNGLKQLSIRNERNTQTDLLCNLVDIWYLDGFSPAKNPDMWSAGLFQQIARLSQEQASLTTFTVAGFVKRALQDVGFRIEKLPSKGKKKEILRGTFHRINPHKGYQHRPIITKPQHVSIIGGGIASACIAYKLAKQGVKITLYCKDETIAQGGSSNAIGALYPLLHQSHDDISLFYQAAFWRARHFYDDIFQQGFHFDHQWCGLLELSYKKALQNRQDKFDQLAAWPKDLIQSVDSSQASRIAGIPLQHGGLFMPNAGWAAPQQLVQKIIQAAEKTGRLKVKTNTHIRKITPLEHSSLDNKETQWKLTTNKGEFNASVLIVCGGAEVIDMDYIKSLPLSATRGQVTSMQSNENISPLNTVICHKGYLTPKNKGIHCIGATFQKNDTNTKTSAEDDKYNLTMLEQCLPEVSKNIHWCDNDISTSKARLRCMSQDHMPVVGAMPDISAHKAIYSHLAKDKNWRYSEPAPVVHNLYVALGLGARGLCSAPLAADIITADICNTPYPVESEMLFNLSPNRFIIRDIIKRKC